MQSEPPSKPDPSPDYDVVMVHGRTDDGEGLKVLRSRPGRLDAAEVRALKEGAPILDGEVIKLSPRPESPALYNVQVQYSAASDKAHAGPARVSTERFRRNWDTIFGVKTESAQTDEPAPDNPRMLN